MGSRVQSLPQGIFHIFPKTSLPALRSLCLRHLRASKQHATNTGMESDDLRATLQRLLPVPAHHLGRELNSEANCRHSEAFAARFTCGRPGQLNFEKRIEYVHHSASWRARKKK